MDTITVKPNRIGVAVGIAVVAGAGVASYLLYKRWVKKNTIVVPAERTPHIVREVATLTPITVEDPGTATLAYSEENFINDEIIIDGRRVTRAMLIEADNNVELATMIEEEIPRPVVYEDISPVGIVTNVFTSTAGIWDNDAELEKRRHNPGEPYVIHQEEFASSESGFQQSTLAYYQGDDTMVDDVTGKVIYNHAGLMGDLLFGYGTNDPNAVYIRNEAMEHEWEILRHTSSYAIEVLGLHADEQMERELRHSAIPRFRMD